MSNIKSFLLYITAVMNWTYIIIILSLLRVPHGAQTARHIIKASLLVIYMFINIIVHRDHRIMGRHIKSASVSSELTISDDSPMRRRQCIDQNFHNIGIVMSRHATGQWKCRGSLQTDVNNSSSVMTPRSKAITSPPRCSRHCTRKHGP